MEKTLVLVLALELWRIGKTRKLPIVLLSFELQSSFFSVDQLWFLFSGSYLSFLQILWGCDWGIILLVIGSRTKKSKKLKFWTKLVQFGLQTIIPQKLRAWFWVSVPIHCCNGYVWKFLHFHPCYKIPIFRNYQRVLKHFSSSNFNWLFLYNNRLDFLQQFLKWNFQIIEGGFYWEIDCFLHAKRMRFYRKFNRNSGKILMSTFESDLKSKHRPIFPSISQRESTKFC